MGLREVGWGGGMDWIDLAHDTDRWQALVNMVMNLQVPYNAENFLCSCSGLIWCHQVWSAIFWFEAV
jgi:hypothetical protein